MKRAARGDGLTEITISLHRHMWNQALVVRIVSETLGSTSIYDCPTRLICATSISYRKICIRLSRFDAFSLKLLSKEWMTLWSSLCKTRLRK